MSNIKFNPQQEKAVDAYSEGAYGVVAAAGSGKTAVILGRIDSLIDKYNVDEEDLLVISFTRNTADELKKRLSNEGYNFVNVGTFHSICMRILRQEGYNLNGYNLIKEWQTDNCLKNIDQKVDVNDVISYISYQKNYLRGYNDEFVQKDSTYTEDQLRAFYEEYETFKEDNDLYDFDDYLLLCLDVLKNNPSKYTFKYILVDEHQDSNMVQNLLLQEWCESGNIFVVGDVRQSIYGFRGGNINYFMNFEKDWNNVEIINLYKNYRSANNIVNQSNHFIKKYFKDYSHYVDAEANNKENGHISVKSFNSRDFESIEVVDKIAELIEDGVPLNEIAVLYRLNKHSNFVEAELKRREIEYDIANDSSFFKRLEVAGIISYMRLIHNVHDDNAFESIFKLRNHPLKFFSNKILNEIKEYAGQRNMSFYEAFISMPHNKQWQRTSVVKFEKDINMLRMQVDKDISVTKLIDNISKVFQMDTYINEKYTNQDEIDERLESINVLKSFVKGNNLEQFIAYVYSNQSKKKAKKDAVRLMSIHKSKGLEFDNVFLVGVEDGQFPDDRSDINEESRLFYVATTRPRWNLYISEIGKGNRFIKEYGIR